MLAACFCVVLLFAVAQGGLPSSPLWTQDDGYPLNVADQWPVGTQFFPDGNIDAIFQRANGKIYFFQGIYFWRVSDRYLEADRADIVDPNYPIDFRTQFALPDTVTKVDAIFQRPNGKIYLFAGDSYWRYEDIYTNYPLPDTFKPDLGYPKKIVDNFYGVPNNVMTGWAAPGGFIFFVDKDYNVYRIRDKYVFENIKDDIVDKCFPKPLVGEVLEPKDWSEFVANKNIFTIWYRRQSNRKMYVFFSSGYARFTNPQLWTSVEREIRPQPATDALIPPDPPQAIVFQRPNGDIWKFNGLNCEICWDPMLRDFTATPTTTSPPAGVTYGCDSFPLSSCINLQNLPSYFLGFTAGFYSSYRGTVYLFYGRDIYTFADKTFSDPTTLEVPTRLGSLDDWGIPSTVSFLRGAYERANGQIFLFSGQGQFYRLSFPKLGSPTDSPTIDPGFLPRPWCVPCRSDADCATATIATCNLGNHFCQTDELCLGTPSDEDYFSGLVTPTHQRRNGFIYSGLWAVPDQNTRVVSECTYPWPLCYSNYECGSQRPYCFNRGTAYASCEACRTDADCSFFPSTPVCNVLGHCYPGPLCVGNNNSYAIGSSAMILFASDMNLERQCCSLPAPTFFAEGIMNAPGWSVLGVLPTLFDPLAIYYQGMRSLLSEAWRWDGLFQTSFAVSATRLSTISYENWVHTLANWGEGSCSRNIPQSWLPLDSPKIFPPADAFQHPGDSQVNTGFYYELQQSDKMFRVRVVWDCTGGNSCQRMIVIINDAGEDLNDINLLFNIDANIVDSDSIPSTPAEFVRVNSNWMGPPISWTVQHELNPSLIAYDGQVRQLGDPDVTDPCLTGAGYLSGFTSEGFTSVMCDYGATVQLSMGTLAAGSWATITTTFQISDSLFPGTFSEGPFDLTFTFRDATSTTSFNALVVSVTESATGTASPPATIPGDCPCINGTCDFSLSFQNPRCVCDVNFLDGTCRTQCVNGVIDDSGECVCNEGWWTDTVPPASPFLRCASKCTCLRGSHCDPSTGNCFCKNGLSGPNCNLINRCTTGQ